MAFTLIDVLTMVAVLRPPSMYYGIVYTAHSADLITRILHYAGLLTTGLVVGVALAWSRRATPRIFFKQTLRPSELMPTPDKTGSPRCASGGLGPAPCVLFVCQTARAAGVGLAPPRRCDP